MTLPPLQALPRPTAGTYYFYVELQWFSNPMNRDHDGGCCDPGCGNCDNYFIFCLRQAGYDEASDVCPYGTFSTAANLRSGSYLEFQSGVNLASNVPNPVRFAGSAWPVSRLSVVIIIAIARESDTKESKFSLLQLGFQLKIRVLDADSDADDLVDYFIIEESSFLPTNEYSSFSTYTGEHSSSVSINLRYRLRCRGNWHGHDCNVHCVDQNTDTAHLECALDGTYVCMDGWQDLSTQCTIREPNDTHTHTHTPL